MISYHCHFLIEGKKEKEKEENCSFRVVVGDNISS